MIANLLFYQNQKSSQMIPKDVFEDLGFLDWSDAYSNSSYTELLECMMNMPTKETILLRQRIFADVLRWKDRFEDWVSMFDRLKSRYQLYTSSKYMFNKSANFLLFMKEYLVYFKKLSSLNQQMPLQSTEFVDYLSKINAYLGSDEYKVIISEIEVAYLALQQILSFSVGMQGKGPQIETLEGKRSLEDKLIFLAQELNVPLDGSKRNPAKSVINPQFIQASLEVYPQEYQVLKGFYEKHQAMRFEYEHMQFAFSYYLFFYQLFKRVGSISIPFAKSEINEEKSIRFQDVYDVMLMEETTVIVPNDVVVTPARHIQLITGVNSGGKTSYIRAIGINLILHLQVGHVFAKSASLAYFPNLFTHFPQDENFRVGSGRLNDELRRLEKMKQQFKEGTILILNETFSSTDEDTALHHTKELLAFFLEKKTSVFFVTHQQKLFYDKLSDAIVVLSPMIDTNNRNKRLYKLMETNDKAASYAYDILYQYKLTKKQLIERLEDKNER